MLSHVAVHRAGVKAAPITTLRLRLGRSYIAADTPPTSAASSAKGSQSLRPQKSTPTLRKESNLINFVFEPFPQPFNCTTLPQTRIFAADPSHPLYIKIQRRVAAHNPHDFIWVVRCPTGVSKKPAYRHDVLKKLRRVFTEALRKRGYNAKGAQLPDEDMARLKQEPGVTAGKTVAEIQGKLSGALSMFYIHDQKRVLMAKGDEIRLEADRVLDKVLQIRHAANKELKCGSDRTSTVAPIVVRNKQEWQLGKERQQRPDRPAYSRSDRKPFPWKPTPERSERNDAIVWRNLR